MEKPVSSPDVKQEAVLVPQRAVQEIQGLYSVMVVKAG